MVFDRGATRQLLTSLSFGRAGHCEAGTLAKSKPRCPGEEAAKSAGNKQRVSERAGERARELERKTWQSRAFTVPKSS